MGREQRANAERRAEIRRIAQELTGRAVDDGQIVMLGFVTMISMVFRDQVHEVPKEQLNQLRLAFFAGAQHLFGSITSMLDPDAEASERDLKRMTLIAHELNAFIDEWKQIHGITDPDVGYHGPPETKQ